LLEALERLAGLKRATKYPLSVAVVITKVDAVGLESEIGAVAADQLIATDPTVSLEEDAISILVRRFLMKNGQGNLVRDLEAQFSNVKYFSCSALGRLPGQAGYANTGFTPIRVMDPLAWLLTNAHAIDATKERTRQVDASQHAIQRKSYPGFAGLQYYYLRSLRPHIEER
jgi:hypothetical protein